MKAYYAVSYVLAVLALSAILSKLTEWAFLQWLPVVAVLGLVGTFKAYGSRAR